MEELKHEQEMREKRMQEREQRQDGHSAASTVRYYLINAYFRS